MNTNLVSRNTRKVFLIIMFVCLLTASMGVNNASIASAKNIVDSRFRYEPLLDEFNSPTLGSHWRWLREDPSHWSLTARPGYLRIVTQPQDIWSDTNNASLLLQSVSNGDFELQTRILITPTAEFHQGGLVIYADDDNYVRLTYAYINGPKFEFAKELSGDFQPIQVPAPPDVNNFHLRVTKLGTNYFAYYSQDGVHWILIGGHQNVNISPIEAGLLAFNAVDSTLIEIPADFDYFRLTPVTGRVANFKSQGSSDGWVLESNETSNQGGTLNSGAITFNLGDHSANQQYRAILHFNTAALPDNAVITRLILKIQRQGLHGTNPFTTHRKIAVDIRRGAFSNAATLQLTDFQAAANKNAAGLIANNPQAGGWYFTRLNAAVFPFIKRTGITQFRLRFQLDDDNDQSADFMKFYSGDAPVANRPQLIVQYYIR